MFLRANCWPLNHLATQPPGSHCDCSKLPRSPLSPKGRPTYSALSPQSFHCKCIHVSSTRTWMPHSSAHTLRKQWFPSFKFGVLSDWFSLVHESVPGLRGGGISQKMVPRWKHVVGRKTSFPRKTGKSLQRAHNWGVTFDRDFQSPSNPPMSSLLANRRFSLTANERLLGPLPKVWHSWIPYLLTWPSRLCWLDYVPEKNSLSRNLYCLQSHSL